LLCKVTPKACISLEVAKAVFVKLNAMAGSSELAKVVIVMLPPVLFPATLVRYQYANVPADTTDVATGARLEDIIPSPDGIVSQIVTPLAVFCELLL